MERSRRLRIDYRGRYAQMGHEIEREALVLLGQGVRTVDQVCDPPDLVVEGDP